HTSAELLCCSAFSFRITGTSRRYPTALACHVSRRCCWVSGRLCWHQPSSFRWNGQNGFLYWGSPRFTLEVGLSSWGCCISTFLILTLSVALQGLARFRIQSICGICLFMNGEYSSRENSLALP